MSSNNIDEGRRRIVAATGAAMGAILYTGSSVKESLEDASESEQPIEVGIYQTESLEEHTQDLDERDPQHPAYTVRNYFDYAFENSPLSELDYNFEVQEPVPIDEEQDLESIQQDWIDHQENNPGYKDSNILITAQQYEEGDGIAETGINLPGTKICGGSHETTSSAVLGAGILLNWLEQDEVREAQVGGDTEDPASVAIGALNLLGQNLCLNPSYAETDNGETTPMGINQSGEKTTARPLFSERSVEEILEGYQEK